MSNFEIENIEDLESVADESIFEEDERLRECPFCKGIAWLGNVRFNDSTVWYNPQCSECNAGWMENFEIKEEAINAWNKRK